MPFASRWDVSLDAGRTLMARLDHELNQLSRKHPAGFSLRLHVLGDFFSVRYVAFWRRALRRHPNLKIFGYTHRTGEIGRAIDQVFTEFYGRFVILQSDPVQETIRPVAMVEGIRPGAENLTLCVEQAGRVNSCLECGLCCSPSIKGVRFRKH